LELILNELSLAPPASDRRAARAWILSLQETLQAAVLRGMPPILRIHERFWSARLAEDYSVVDWLADPTIERERRQQLRSAVSKAPFLEALHESAEAAQGKLIEVLWEGHRGLGIGLAAMHDYPVVSLPALSFCIDPLSVYVVHVDDRGSSEKIEPVCNLYDSAVVERRGSWIARRQQQELSSGAEMVRCRADLLERLDFTASALDQLMALRGSEKVFPFVMRHLFALNERARSWDGTTPFSAGYPFRCSEESAPTLAMYGDARTFLCPDGVRRMFSWHSKINWEQWRIYFIDSPATRRVLVGYVGKHMPLAG
jgi:hypothetical protein